MLKTYWISMRTFTVVWAGQLVSTIGSNLTGFGLGVWIYEETGSTTLFALNLLAVMLPNVLLSPLAGLVVDRGDRRLVMIMADAGAGLSTLAVALLFWGGWLELWHIYLATAFISAFGSFQWPAYSAATSLLVPKEHLGRAGGMVQLGEAVSMLIAPALAGALFVTRGLGSIILLDFATFLFAIVTLLFVRFPRPEAAAEETGEKSSFWQEAAYGWAYIFARPGLSGLLTLFAALNFLGSLTYPLLTPMILDMASPDVLGYISSISGVGMLVSTLVMSAWGGARRRVFTILLFEMMAGTCLALTGLRPSLVLIAAAGFGFMFTLPITNGASQALWQSKVAPDVQGRVFAARSMLAFSIIPVAYALAGPLSERVFEPLMAVGGPLAESVAGRVIGSGPGRGIGLMFVLAGLLHVLSALTSFLYSPIRRIDLELPDAVPDSPDAASA